VSLVADPDRRWIHALISRYATVMLRLNPLWQVKVSGRERIPQGAAVWVANHQSMADIVVALSLLRQFKFVSKASLFRLPIVGWMMRFARYVEVVRGSPRSMGRMMATSREWLGRQMAILIFPEGTYSGGTALLPFKRGAFELAISEKVPLLPLVIEGTDGLVHEDGPLLGARARVRVQVLEPIPPEALGHDAAALSSRVRTLMEDALSRLTA
jgi:1-acyl-sn-glycerol-3-phosphate acyltransferase